MFVYFIRAGKKGAIKIGHARNVERRLDQFQVGNAFKLYLLAKLQCDSKAHAMGMERNFHNYFRRQRIRGEWFQGNIQFKKAIDSLEKQALHRNKVLRQDRKDRKQERSELCV